MSAERAEELAARARSLLAVEAQRGVRAPAFGAQRDWLNVRRPLEFDGALRGRVVLVDFFTASCVHCAHAREDLRRLARRFADDAFTIVGCHSARSPEEAPLEAVRDLVLREGLEHPVVLDHEFDVARRFGVRAWPTQVLVDPRGRVLTRFAGEGQYALLEVAVRAALELGAADLQTGDLALSPEVARELPRELAFPSGLAWDAAGGRLYVADSGHHRVLCLTAGGSFVDAWGDGEPGRVDGAREEARFRDPRGLALHGRELFVADTGNHCVRAIDLERGALRTVAGTGERGVERAGSFPALGVALASPYDVAVDDRHLWIAACGAHQVWELDRARGVLAPRVGAGRAGAVDGPAAGAALAQPSGLALGRGRLFVADADSRSVRVLRRSASMLETLGAGGAAPGLRRPLALALAGGELAVADAHAHALFVLDAASGAPRARVGGAAADHVDGTLAEARLRAPAAVCAFDGRWLLADASNHALRVVDPVRDRVTTLRLDDVPVPRAALARSAAEPGHAPLPDWSATRRAPPVAATVKPGDVRVALDLGLAPGETLAAGAPSQFRVLHRDGLVGARAPSGRLEGSPAGVVLSAAGAGRCTVQALWYVADPAGRVRVRACAWDLDLGTSRSEGDSALRLAAPR